MRRFAITLDTDDTPDAAIDFTADLLAAHAVKATWFVQHESPAIERLARRGELFELISGTDRTTCLLPYPAAWQDELELEKSAPSWDFAPLLAREQTLTVLAFRPLHVLLNSNDASRYKALKNEAPALREASAAQLGAYAQGGLGTRSMLLSALAQLSGGEATLRMREL
jgi:hypothetical protein